MEFAMRLLAPTLILMTMAGGAAGADRHKLDIDPESEDGFLLQRIRQEPTVPRRLALLEKYAAQYPTATSAAWVYEQLIPIYAETQQYDKVLESADKLLAIDSTDLDSAHAALRAAEARKDADLMVKYAELSWDLATRTAGLKPPSDPEAAAEWKKQAEFAKDVLPYCEFLLYSVAKQTTDPARKAQVLHELEVRNAHSQYLEVARKEAQRLQVGAGEITVEAAEKGLVQDPDNEDMLMTMAEFYFSRESELSKSLSYSLHVLDALPRRSAPEGVNAEDFERKKAQYAGIANWMIGVIYAKDARYGLSDRYLRAALASIHEKPQLLAAAYYYLGYDNYAIAGEVHDRGRIQEAMKYNKLCVAMGGAYMQLAQKNIELIRNEYNVE
jgi:hypothetical protein